MASIRALPRPSGPCCVKDWCAGPRAGPGRKAKSSQHKGQKSVTLFKMTVRTCAFVSMCMKNSGVSRRQLEANVRGGWSV